MNNMPIPTDTYSGSPNEKYLIEYASASDGIYQSKLVSGFYRPHTLLNLSIYFMQAYESRVR